MERARHQRNRGEGDRRARGGDTEEGLPDLLDPPTPEPRAKRVGRGHRHERPETRRQKHQRQHRGEAELEREVLNRGRFHDQEHPRGEGQRVERVGVSLQRASEEDQGEHQCRANRRRLIPGEDDVSPDQWKRRERRWATGVEPPHHCGDHPQHGGDQRGQDESERRDVQPAHAQDVGQAAPGEAVLPLGTELRPHSRGERAHQRRVVRTKEMVACPATEALAPLGDPASPGLGRGEGNERTGDDATRGGESPGAGRSADVVLAPGVRPEVGVELRPQQNSLAGRRRDAGVVPPHPGPGPCCHAVDAGDLEHAAPTTGVDVDRREPSLQQDRSPRR
jgi:hypothetical protein